MVPSVVPIPNEGSRASFCAASGSCRLRGESLRQDEQGFLGRDLECSDLEASIPEVEALPIRNQMTFGGAPFTNDRLRKSSSLEITVKPCSRA